MPFSLGSIKMNTFQRQSNSLCLKLNLRNTVNQAACWKFRRSSISNLSFIDFPSRGILIGSNAGVSMPCGWNGYRILSPDLTNAACFVLRIFENITLKERLPFSFQQDLRPPAVRKVVAWIFDHGGGEARKTVQQRYDLESVCLPKQLQLVEQLLGAS